MTRHVVNRDEEGRLITYHVYNADTINGRALLSGNADEVAQSLLSTGNDNRPLYVAGKYTYTGEQYEIYVDPMEFITAKNPR